MSTSFVRACTRIGTVAICGALFGGAAPALAAVGGFEGGDGNQTCETVADWACPTGSVLRADDTPAPNDDVFAAGSKELEPKGWSFQTNGTSDKTDLQSIWRTTAEPVAGQSFLNLAIKRAVDNGDTHVSFELNQKRTTWVNSVGTTIPCRTNGDVLVSYSISERVTVSLFKWQGTEAGAGCPDGAKGTWVAGPGAPAVLNAGLNGADIPNVLPIIPAQSTFKAGTFAEASLDMATIAEELDFTKTCEFFTGLQAHSRSSSEITSTMKDIVASIAISVVACEPEPGGGGGGGGDTTAPVVPTIGNSASCLQSRSVTLSGVTEPGAQVVVRDGSTSVGLTDADGAGAWSITLTDVADGAHGYSATAIDAAGNASAASTSVPVFVDASPDAATVITSPADGSSVIQGPLVISGTAEPGSTVAVSDGTTFLGTTVAGGAGAWQYTLDGPVLGVHDLSATATDSCNASASTARSSVTVTDGAGGSGGGGTGGDAPTGSTPVGDASVPVTGVSALGSLPLTAVPLGGMPTACAGKVFSTFVTDRKNLLSHVVFKVDGKVVATIRKRDKQRRFLVRINPRKYKAGERRLTATLVAKSKKTKQTTVTRRFRRCEACKSRRGFSIRLVRPNGEKLRSATVFVNNRKVRTIRGERLTAPVRLVGLPKGTYKVRIRAVTVSGRVSTSVRTYRTCVKKVARKLATKKKP